MFGDGYRPVEFADWYFPKIWKVATNFVRGRMLLDGCWLSHSDQNKISKRSIGSRNSSAYAYLLATVSIKRPKTCTWTRFHRGRVRVKVRRKMLQRLIFENITCEYVVPMESSVVRWSAKVYSGCWLQKSGERRIGVYGYNRALQIVQTVRVG